MDDGGLVSIYTRCLGYARRICPRDPAVDPEDVLQAALLRAYPHLAALPDDEARRKYLNRAILTVVLDHQRRIARRPQCVPLHVGHLGGDAEDEALVGLALGAALAVAPPVVVLQALGYLYQEIGAALGISPQAAKVRAHRWRAAHERMEA